MEKYDYLSAVKENVKSWINDNDEWKAEMQTRTAGGYVMTIVMILKRT
jgi:hypothetical protein